MSTIFALASAPGKAGVSVVRLSGPWAFEAVQSLCGPLPPARLAGLRALTAKDGRVLDQALVLQFPAPASFTGEDVVELHLHGSTAVVSSVLDELGSLGCILAEAGEFTRRALENEKLDLAEVEGLADLIDAETEAQRAQAFRVLSGALGDLVEDWRRKLIRAASLIEATIDFADEDVPEDVTPEVSALLEAVQVELEKESAGVLVAERVRTGFEVAIIGAPNTGKSTLINNLAGREAAITSEVAGTTRDVIEVRMDLSGLPVTFLDTAGVRDTDDAVEKIGIARALERAESADIRVILSEDPQHTGIPARDGDIVLMAKSDEGSPVDGVSGLTGYGIEALVGRLSEALSNKAQRSGVSTRHRHRVAMTEASTALDEARRLLQVGQDHYDIAADEIRVAIRRLESLIGRIDVESLLDEIFLSFCIGK
jgi:tRNA modification GTPase